MGKLKTVLILLLTVLLVICVAYLPRIVASVQDKGTMGEVHYGQTQSVQLEIREKVSSMGKLAMLGRLGGTIDIPDGKASMTREEVELAAMEALQPYVDAGLVSPFSVYSMDIRCVLGHTAIGPALSGIFWTVFLTGDEEGLFAADLIIDDETGRLLHISITDNFFAPAVGKAESLAIFAELYFTGLDIPDYGQYATDHLDDWYIGENVEGVRYWFPETDYGEIFMDFYIHQYGFYNQIPG